VIPSKGCEEGKRLKAAAVLLISIVALFYLDLKAFKLGDFDKT